jgi:hypothetical protein
MHRSMSAIDSSGVATHRDLPLVVIFDENRGHEPRHLGVGREDAGDVGTPIDPRVHSLEWVRRPQLPPM